MINVGPCGIACTICRFYIHGQCQGRIEEDSDKAARYDVEVAVKAPEGGLLHNSIVLLNQIRTIDKQRVRRYWGRLSAQTMQQVDEAIKISLGLVPI